MGDNKALDLTVMSLPSAEILRITEVPGWCDLRHIRAGYALAEGYSQEETAKVAGVSPRTICMWLNERPTSAEYRAWVDRLSFHTGLALRSERLKLVKKLARDLGEQGILKALRKHDVVDLVRLAGELSGDVTIRPDAPFIQFISNKIEFITPAPASVGGVVDGDVKVLSAGDEEPE